MRSLIVALSFAAAGCTGTQDSNIVSCGQECADYYTVRAIDAVHTKVWASKLSTIPTNPKDNVATYKDILIPCSEGSMTANGQAAVETDGSVSIDVTLVHDACNLGVEPQEAGGYEITIDGIVEWGGSFSSNGLERTFTYQSSELAVSGTVFQLGAETDVDETCTLQASLTATSNEDFSFAGAWCQRDIVDQSGG